jgi:3-hydroxybutyryl-CoA dehydrogenase
MKLEDIKKIGVVGAGTMGHGIALSFALWGYPVTMCDVTDEMVDNGMKRIRSALDTFVEENVVPRKQADDAISNITTATDLKEVAQNSDYICEAITERSKDKFELFNKLDEMCPPHTIIVSNTSSLVLSDFGRGAKRQDKIAVTHYFNPPHICPCVEVVKGPGTSNETYNLTYDLLQKVKKTPVRILKELPGYLVNRIQFAMNREVSDLLDKGVATAEDIDLAVKSSFGFRLASIGPLLTSDLGGGWRWGQPAIELRKKAYKQICSDLEPPASLIKRYEAKKPQFDYPQEKWDQIIKQRDREFLHRLKELYWK